MDPKVRSAIQSAIDRCFFMNALCDRMYYVMKGQWYMKEFSKLFHEKVAHAYPAIADALGDVLLGEAQDVTRGAMNSQAQDYTGPTQMLEMYRDEVLATRAMISDAYYAAFDYREPGVAALLEDVLEDYQEDMVSQAIRMAGKATQYGDNDHQIDNDADLFF